MELVQASPEWKRLRRGWCWGPKEFREELLELIGQRQGQQHYGAELKESEEQKAQRLIGELLREAGWTEAELQRRRKGDARKAGMAMRLRAETTMAWSWIARRQRGAPGGAEKKKVNLESEKYTISHL